MFSSCQCSWQQIKNADGFIRTADFRCMKQLFYQLCHNHCIKSNWLNFLQKFNICTIQWTEWSEWALTVGERINVGTAGRQSNWRSVIQWYFPLHWLRLVSSRVSLIKPFSVFKRDKVGNTLSIQSSQSGYQPYGDTSTYKVSVLWHTVWPDD